MARAGQNRRGMYLICDWASNVLQYNGKFNFSAYGANKGSPMEFKTFEDGWEYIYQNFKEEDYEDLYVDKRKD